jgi:hypothetical protein
VGFKEDNADANAVADADAEADEYNEYDDSYESCRGATPIVPMAILLKYNFLI